MELAYRLRACGATEIKVDIPAGEEGEDTQYTFPQTSEIEAAHTRLSDLTAQLPRI
jgi:hypothetical protein